MAAAVQFSGASLTRGFVSVGLVVTLGAAAFGLVAWRSASNRSGVEVAPGTKVRGMLAVTHHGVPPVFGGDMTIRCQLPVRNWWDEPVHFKVVVPSCACSSAELAVDKLAPGETTTLTVEVKMPPVGGRRIISCQLQTDSGQTAVHDFEAVAYPHVQLDAESELVALGKLHAGEQRVVSVRLALHAPHGSALPTIQKISTDDEQLSATVTSIGPTISLADGSGSRADAIVKLLVRATDKPGRFSRDLSVEYVKSDGLAGRAHLLAAWEVESLIRVEPARVFLSFSASESHSDSDPLLATEQATIERTLTLSSDDGRAFRVVSANADAVWLQVDKLPVEPASEHRLTVRLSPALVESSRYTALVIVVDHPKQSSVSVPFTIVKRDATGIVQSSDSSELRGGQ